MRWFVVLVGLITAMVGLIAGIRKLVAMAEQRAYRAADEAASQERIRFLQRLDHELKNPLTAMQIALANLDALEDADKKHEIRQGMRRQVVRMSRLISDLRKLALLDQTLIEQMPVNTGALLREALEGMDSGGEASQRYFVTEFDAATLPTIVGDRDLLQVAIYNLLDNAVKFTQPGDSITLRAYTDNTTLSLEVEDTGPGIAPEDLPHIWEDLYRSKSVQGIPGSGIGLAMVKGIVERHGGTVHIRSRSVKGRGALVRIALPIDY